MFALLQAPIYALSNDSDVWNSVFFSILFSLSWHVGEEV